MEKEKRAQQANVFMQGWRPPRLASWGTPGDPWAREAGLQIPLRRSPPLCQGLPVTPAHRQQHSPKNAHVYQRARAHTHTHTHTHTLQARVPACRLSSSGLCIPYLHDLTIRQNNTQGAHLLVSPRSTPHPQPAPLPPAPSPGAGNLLFKAGEQTGREQLASPESSLALQTPGDGGGRGAWRPDCVRCRLAMDKSTQAPSDCNPRGLQAPR